VVAGPELDCVDEIVQRLAGDGELLIIDACSRPCGHAPVTVQVTGGPDTVAVLDLGVRLAREQGVPLHLAGRSRGPRWSSTASLAARLFRANVDVRPLPDERAGSGLVITDGGQPISAGRTHIRVHAARPGTSDDLTRRLAASATVPNLLRSLT
jgi:hypothetical protein